MSGLIFLRRSVILLLLTALLLSGCSESVILKKGDVPVTDADGKTFYVSKSDRVVCAYGSFAECWLLSGGRLVGVTEDAVSERGLDIGEDVAVVGTVKEINLELLVSLDPHFVILSADLTAHRQLAHKLISMGISAALFRVDSFDDYDKMMSQFCKVNGTDGLYASNVTEVRSRIELLKSSVPSESTGKTSLVMRVYSNGIKVKTDNLAEDIAVDLGCVSIAKNDPSLLSDLSVEAIVSADPDFIFVLTMGDEEDAVRYLDAFIEGNPAFASLSAVKNGRLVLLPKELFHYKPNNRWDESYEYMAKIIYPEIFGQ